MKITLLLLLSLIAIIAVVAGANQYSSKHHQHGTLVPKGHHAQHEEYDMLSTVIEATEGEPEESSFLSAITPSFSSIVSFVTLSVCILTVLASISSQVFQMIFGLLAWLSSLAHWMMSGPTMRLLMWLSSQAFVMAGGLKAQLLTLLKNLLSRMEGNKDESEEKKKDKNEDRKDKKENGECECVCDTLSGGNQCPNPNFVSNSDKLSKTTSATETPKEQVNVLPTDAEIAAFMSRTSDISGASTSAASEPSLPPASESTPAPPAFEKVQEDQCAATSSPTDSDKIVEPDQSGTETISNPTDSDKMVEPESSVLAPSNSTNSGKMVEPESSVLAPSNSTIDSVSDKVSSTTDRLVLQPADTTSSPSELNEEYTDGNSKIYLEELDSGSLYNRASSFMNKLALLGIALTMQTTISQKTKTI